MQVQGKFRGEWDAVRGPFLGDFSHSRAVGPETLRRSRGVTWPPPPERPVPPRCPGVVQTRCRLTRPPRTRVGYGGQGMSDPSVCTPDLPSRGFKGGFSDTLPVSRTGRGTSAGRTLGVHVERRGHPGMGRGRRGKKPSSRGGDVGLPGRTHGSPTGNSVRDRQERPLCPRDPAVSVRVGSPESLPKPTSLIRPIILILQVSANIYLKIIQRSRL